ncbi:MAG: cellulose biosynthesis cyclic di-GMP-binding regulatory protein BcsB [Anaerolineales bacterium]|nr:MAG: cellulose biosynthesis cyclic di-GMP-binding regulatory protein BcsB [Anaerolineales bacterium]
MATAKRITLALIALALLAAGPAAPALQTGTQLSETTLVQLGAEPFAALQGPYSSLALSFTTPPNWDPQADSTLTLDLQSFFSSFVPAQGEVPQQNLVAGHISVRLDGALLHRSVLSSNGEQQISLALEPGLLAAQPQHTLHIDWDASASCQFNLSSTVLVQPSSMLSISYAEAAIEPSLAQLPYPFYSPDALQHPGTLIVLPPAPTQGQVAAALTVAAALGRFAPQQAIELAVETTLTEAALAEKHLVYVGQVESFRDLQSPTLPHNQDATLRQPAANRAGLGFIEVARSPWNIQRAILVVSGGSEAAVQRAALAVGSPLVLNERNNLAYISQDTQPSLQPTDTLASNFSQLGQTDFTFTRFGRSELRVPFYISPDRAISDAAFLDLRFAHSQLLDYLRSSVTVHINGQAVSTTRLVDQTAPRHSEVTLLPASILKPGMNELVISADVVPLDLCANPAEGDHWLTIYADSLISVPTSNDPLVRSELTLGEFPLPFLHNSMQDTALLLPESDPAAWANAARLLRGLAASYQAWPLLPSVQVGSSSAAFASAPADNIILLGDFDDFLSDLEMQTIFAVERAGGSGELALSDGSRLGYSPTVPLAIASLNRLAPANNATSLALLGNTPASLQSVVEALTAPGFPRRSSGVLLLAQQGATAIQDTRPAASGQPQATAIAELTQPSSGPVSTGKGIWLWPLLALLLAAFGLVVWEQLAGWLRRRKKAKS